MKSHRVTALSVCLVVLASLFAVACTDPNARPNSPSNFTRAGGDERR